MLTPYLFLAGDEKKEALPSGFYLECDTRIKINVKCKGPIFSITGLGNVINRAILVLKKQDISILKTILQFVEDSNRAQLGLESIEELRRYRLSPEQRNNVNLDIVTGFLISDSEIFWLFFEGCLYNGMISLIELLKKYNLENDPNVITIIDTNLRYPHRQWTEVFPNICWIHLKGSVSKNIKSEKAFLSSYLSPETLKLLRTCHDDISLVSPSTFHMMFNTYSPSLETFCLIRDISLHASHFIDIESLAKFCPLSIPFEITLPPSSIMNQAKPVFSLPKLKKITPRQKATPENKKPVIKAPPRERSPLDFSRPIYLYSLQSLNTRRSLQKEVLRACQNTKNLYVFPFAPHRTLELNEI
ncbi:hypothetical protein HMI54_006434 [Coelomomyces lativittatus]|nr:hypothetical protein HMI54_006434 [Coelomomyces lativittatus]